MADRIGVVFVCLGNICRSPLAEGAFRAHVDAAGLGERFHIDSAGTGRWHVGEPPDPRSVSEARAHGVDIGRQRGRQLVRADFERFEHVVVMDDSNRRDASKLADGAARGRLSRLLDEIPGGVREVPDPYYGGEDGFAHVWDLVHGATAALLDRIRRQHGL